MTLTFNVAEQMLVREENERFRRCLSHIRALADQGRRNREFCPTSRELFRLIAVTCRRSENGMDVRSPLVLRRPIDITGMEEG